MIQYKKYRIGPTDSFNPNDFPKVVGELADLKEQIAHTPVAHKKEILISFFKKQSLDADWRDRNPELVNLVTSGSFATDHLKSLFDSSDLNKKFQEEYENYLLENIS